jgi:ABC-type antimicrobial peptide transport system permease subunit
MVTLEATYTTALGFGIGVVGGYGLNWFISVTNLMGPLVETYYSRILEGLALSDELILTAQLSYLAWAGTTILFASFLAIVVPGRRVRELNPAEAMRAA